LFDFYAHFYSDKKYDELLRELIAGQRNLGVLTVLGKYAKFNRKCELIPDLVESMNCYKKIPRDSVWEVQISHNYKKLFSTEMLYWHGGHFEDVDLLVKN
jgi:nitric oxide synthase oxygenase domain/subunit